MSPTPARLAPLAVLTALALVGTATSSVAATRRPADTAAPVITAITVNPSPVVLGTKSGGRTAFAVAVRARDTGVGVDRVTLGLYDPADNSGRAFRLSRTGGSAAEGLWTGLVSLPNNVKTGTWAVRAFATDEASNTTNPDAVYTNFRVLQKTRLYKFVLKVDRATGALNATALLERFRAGKGWEPFQARAVSLQFAPKGEEAFKTVTKATTDARGNVAFDRVVLTKPGTWRVSYSGHPNYGPSTSKPAPLTDPAPTPQN